MQSLNLAKILDIPKLPGYIKQIDEQLLSAVSLAVPELQKPLQDIVSSRGKRFRSSLLIASALDTKIDDNVILACSAIELAHLGSLVHDDIIDNSANRWGKPTTVSSIGTSQAMLVGDFLLAKSCLQAAKLSNEAAQLLSETITILAAGEALEISTINNLSRPVSSYFKCIKAKSAALISSACYLGGVCANLTPTQTSALGQYGESLGISFQLIDDLMDLLSTPQLMGKPTNSDAAQGIYTLPVLLSLKGPNKNKLKKILNKSSINNDELIAILLADGSIQETIKQIRKYNQLAQISINKLKALGLKSLPDAYFNWALNNLVQPRYQNSLLS